MSDVTADSYEYFCVTAAPGSLTRDDHVSQSSEYFTVLSSTSSNGYEYMHGADGNAIIRDYANTTDFYIMSEDISGNEWYLTGASGYPVYEHP
jgi:hypothetical protein